ncbi:MAG TPA: helix-turn-helix domain-containing protein, partial [Solirubrobacteraceae bacterium]|nr:helix-turn-helix domain-containing protein [Solirubrobacteraceae bacterium]
RCALEAVRFANGDAPEVASHRDLGSFHLLLSLQDDEALRRSTAIQGRLERLVLEERGLGEVMRMVAEAIGGSATVLGARGDTIASSGTLEAPAWEALGAAIGARGEVAGPLRDRALVLPVVGRDRGAAQAWIAGVCDHPLGDFERLILQQAATVVALELMRLRIARDTERRLAGDVLAEALTGRLHPEELAARLRPFGIGEQVAVLAFVTDDPVAAEAGLDAALARADVRALVAVRGSLLCAIVDAADRDPIELARVMRAELSAAHGAVRAAASRAASTQSLRRSFHEARCALEAVRFANGDAPEVASHRDLGSFHLLLSLQDDEALRSYCDGVLAGVEEGDPDYAEELLRSLDAYLEHNGHWEHAAAEVFCHRHTLRYRIRRVEELTGRSLANPRDRIEFWLALRGRELAL